MGRLLLSHYAPPHTKFLTVPQSSYLVDYARRQRAGKPVGTSTSEGLANALVNRRMNKLQQMRWSTAGAHAVVTVRANVMNEAPHKMPTTIRQAA